MSRPTVRAAFGTMFAAAALTGLLAPTANAAPAGQTHTTSTQAAKKCTYKATAAEDSASIRTKPTNSSTRVGILYGPPHYVYSPNCKFVKGGSYKCLGIKSNEWKPVSYKGATRYVAMGCLAKQ